MVRKQHTAEQIVTLLRQIEVALGTGTSTAQACRETAITEHTYYRWRKEYGGLKVPKRQLPRGRLWLTDGACIRLRPERVNHIWSYDFVGTRTHDGRTVRVLRLIAEYMRECLALRVDRRLNSPGVIDTLADVMPTRGIPDHLPSGQRDHFSARGTCVVHREPGCRVGTRRRDPEAQR